MKQIWQNIDGFLSWNNFIDGTKENILSKNIECNMEKDGQLLLGLSFPLCVSVATFGNKSRNDI